MYLPEYILVDSVLSWFVFSTNQWFLGTKERVAHGIENIIVKWNIL